MGHQFNYELDDRQIKLTMLNASLPYDESAWEKFKTLPIEQHKSTFTTSLPKVEIGISRSVIVPVLFIVMIGGLSTFLFSIIDFKKKETISHEIPLVQPEIIKKEIKVTIPSTIKKEPQKTESTAINTKTVASAPVASASVSIKNEPTVANKPHIEKVKETQPIAITKTVATVVKTTTNNIVPVIKKKRKQATEEIPVIIPQTTIINETPATEPDIIVTP